MGSGRSSTRIFRLLGHQWGTDVDPGLLAERVGVPSNNRLQLALQPFKLSPSMDDECGLGGRGWP